MSEQTSGKTSRGLGTLENFTAVIKNVDNSMSLSISELITSMSIYEDIFAKTIYGQVSIKDSVNLMNGMSTDKIQGIKAFPIVGEEYLEVEYKVSGEKFEPIKRRFAIYAINDIKINKEQTTRDYVIHFCSEEHLIDATSLVQKSYKTTIDEMVKDILESYLKVNDETKDGKRKKTYDIQPTKGTQHIIIPKLSPLDSMDFLAKRSIAKTTFESASYLFFENKDGFNFCDIEYLIHRGKAKLKKFKDDENPYQYYYSDTKIADKADDRKSFKTILSMTQKHKFDTVEKLKRGYFESEIMWYDFIKKKIGHKHYKFADKYTDFNVLGAGGKSSVSESSYPENSLDFIRSVTTEPESGVAKILGIFGLTKEQPSKNSKTFWIPKDSSEPETYLEDIYPNRASYMTRLAQNMFTVEVYGDPTITAGDVILLDLPEISGSTVAKGFDTFLSGYFMVTSIHHRLTSETYSCTYDLFKNGFSTPVISTENADRPEPSNSAYLNNAADLGVSSNAKK